jgi:hypothetical protein
MALYFVLVSAVFGSLVNGIAYKVPRATSFTVEEGFDGKGRIPVPTTAPHAPHELLRRGLFDLGKRELDSIILVAEDQTCGYFSGSPGEDYSIYP